MPIKILATGDLHLGRRSSGVPGNEPAGSPAYTWDLMVGQAIQADVDLLVLLGDIVDRDNRYFEALGPLLRGFTKLKEHHIQVVMISGNHDHDVPRQVARTATLDNVRLLGQGGTWEVMAFTRGSQTIQLVGWSFPADHVRHSPMATFDRAAFDSSLPLIGLLHCDVGMRDSHYAPVMLDELLRQPADAWLLGHIHKPMVLHTERPLVCYTGSPHAFSAKEPGVHGPLLLTIDDHNHISTATWPLSPTRYETIRLSVDSSMDKAALRTQLMQVMLADARQRKEEAEPLQHMVYDICLEGSHPQVNELEAWAGEVLEETFHGLISGMNIYVRKLENRVAPAVTNLKELAGSTSPVGMLAETILAIQQDRSTPMLSKLVDTWKREHQTMRAAGTYIPLMNHPLHDQQQDAMAREYILKECNRLVSELIAQQPGTTS